MLEYRKVDPEFSLDKKTAIITGGAAGIGAETARFFAKKGVNIVLADLNPKVDDVAKSISKDAIGVPSDITKDLDRKEILEKAIQKFGQVDILVNSAGIVALESAQIISEQDWDRTININLKASFMMAQLIGKYFIDNEIKGSIVNIASQAGSIAIDKHVAYCASKGGIIAMTKVLALEWGKFGIRVNCVSPTIVLTELGHKAWDGPVGDKVKKEMPSERFAEPDEVAGVIAFLCSNAANMITGHDLLIDGGYTIK